MALRRDSAGLDAARTAFGVVQVEAVPKARIAVLGLGYIGFPTSLMFVLSGHEVVGVDLNQRTVESLNSGCIHLSEEGFAECFNEVMRSGRFRAVVDVEPADVFIIAVPTPAIPHVGADLSYVRAASASIAEVLRPGCMIVLESTVPPGTCTQVIGPIVEKACGLRHGIDYDLVHCPERVIPGRILNELVENERIVGGTSPEAGARAAALYAEFVKGRIHITDATTAELVKVMENTFRDVNIALANEFRDICRCVGADAYEAIALANHHPRVNIHQPGIGVGGHCIPVDPWFLVEAAPAQSKLVRTAREINGAIPSAIAERTLEVIRDRGCRCVAFLGLAYKPDIEDLRESPAVEIAAHVAALFDGRCLVVEPHCSELPPKLAALGRVEMSSLEEARSRADLIVTLVPHSLFRVSAPPVSSPEALLDFARIWSDADPMRTPTTILNKHQQSSG